MVPTDRWYIERTVWLIAGFVLLASTAMALLMHPLWILGVTATGLVSINVAFTGFCPVGNVLRLFGFTPMLGGVYGTEPDGSLDDKADLIAAVLHREKLDPRNTIMVGDRLHDIHGAHANGLPAIGVLWGYGSRTELEEAGADTLVSQPSELLAI